MQSYSEKYMAERPACPTVDAAIKLVDKYESLIKYKPTIKSQLRRGVSFRIGTKTERAGTSRIGGNPDVPSDFQWPYRDKQPMTFLCQFNLAEISQWIDSAPKSGSL